MTEKESYKYYDELIEDLSKLRKELRNELKEIKAFRNEAKIEQLKDNIETVKSEMKDIIKKY